MAGKKFLLIADYPAQEERIREVAFAFMEKAFLTDSVLYIIVDMNNKDAFNYYRWLSRNVFFGSVKFQLGIRQQNAPDPLLKQMNYYIVGNHPEELIYIDAAIKNNVEIIGTSENISDAFDEIPVTPEIQQARKNFKAGIKRDLLKKFPPNLYEYFLFHEGLGESMALFFWLKEYKKTSTKKILMICVQPLREEMMKSCPYVDAVVRVPPQVFDYMSIYLAAEYDMRKVLTAHFSPKTLEVKKNLPVDQLHTYGIPGTIRDFLGVDPSVKFEPYPIELPKAAVAKATNLFEQMNLTRGKTVLLVTEGIAFGGLQHHNDFWARLAKRLKDKGYEVLTNGAKEEIAGCRNIFLSLFETSVFAGLCGHIVSSPTGFVEALCTFNTTDKFTLQVIFPGAHDVYWKRSSVLHRNVELDSLRYYGRKFVERNIFGYFYQVDQYISRNTDFSVQHWGDNVEEDDALIEKIIGKITSQK